MLRVVTTAADQRVVAAVAIKPVTKAIADDIVVALFAIDFRWGEVVEINVEGGVVVDMDNIDLIVAFESVNDLAAIRHITIVSGGKISCHNSLLITRLMRETMRRPA